MDPVIEVTSTDEATVVRVGGEVDVSCANPLRETLAAELAQLAAGDALAVDLADVAYIDSTGIGVLVGAAHHAADAGVRFSVVNPQRNVARVLGLLRVEEELHVTGAASSADRPLAQQSPQE